MGSEDESFIVLFNPWCIDDAMFMNSQADRNEYVLMDTGCIYAGNKLDHNRLPWIYGQVEKILCLTLWLVLANIQVKYNVPNHNILFLTV